MVDLLVYFCHDGRVVREAAVHHPAHDEVEFLGPCPIFFQIVDL